MENMFARRWVLTKESKICMAADLKTSQADLAKLLFDGDKEVRQQAAKHPGVAPQDMIRFLREYPEEAGLCTQTFLMMQFIKNS